MANSGVVGVKNHGSDGGNATEVNNAGPGRDGLSAASDQSHNNETQPLLGGQAPVTASEDQSSPTEEEPSYLRLAKHVKFALLLLGVFLANVDTSFVLAVYNTIASHYSQAAFGSWVLVAYNFGYTIALPMYGAIADAFGSKTPLLAAYLLFAIGCVLSGSAVALWQVVLGRAVAGAGGAGMTTVVAVIITERVEPSKVAVLRSYVNLMAIGGRSSGGPIGGIITDSLGWRWSFFIQVPVVALCIIAAAWKEPMGSNRQDQHLPKANGNGGNVKVGKPKRSIDAAGIGAFAILLTSILLGITAVGTPQLLSIPAIIAVIVIFCISGVSLVLLELYYAKTPVIPFLQLKGASGVQMLIQTLLLFAQFSVVSNIGTYFARTQASLNSVAALHLLPVAVGNAIGALSAGRIIRQTKHYKTLATCGLLACTAGYILMALRWQHVINVWESLYVALSSLGIGIVNSTQFVALTVDTPKERMASLVSFFFLSQQVGMMLGASVSSAMLHRIFQHHLIVQLGLLPRKSEIIRRILEDTRYAMTLPKSVQAIVISSYTTGFSAVCFMSSATSVILQVLLACLKEKSIV